MTVKPLLVTDILRSIQNEASNAHKKHGDHSMLYEDDRQKLSILMEEVGECAHEHNELVLGNIDRSTYLSNQYKELTQVAAMAATWMLAILYEIEDE